MPVTNEHADFFNEQQKKVKGEIMHKLMTSVFFTLTENKEHFNDAQSICDLIFSLLVMFNREVASHLFISFDMKKDADKCLTELFDTIREQVKDRLSQI